MYPALCSSVFHRSTAARCAFAAGMARSEDMQSTAVSLFIEYSSGEIVEGRT